MNNNSLNILGQLRLMETRGYSAYEVAQLNGYTGTEQEWLESLVGPQGPQGIDGRSAYQVAVDNGYIGTEEDWVNDFMTPDGYYNKDEVDEKFGIICSNIEEMKSLNLKEGMTVRTLGYYEANDGGGSIYRIREKLQEDTDDGGSIHIIDNLVAELIVENDTVNVKQFGAKGDGISDDTESIKNSLKYNDNRYKKIVFNKNETYLVHTTLYLYSNSDIELNDCTLKVSSRLLILNNIDSIKRSGYGVLKNINIKNGTFDGSTVGILFGLLHGENINIENITFLDCSLASHIFDLGGCKNVNIINCNFTGSYINESLSDKYDKELIQIDYANYTALPYWGNSEDYQFDDLPTINVLIERCNFEIGNGNHYPNAIGTHAVYGVKALNNIHIVNNIFDACTYSNIRFP